MTHADTTDTSTSAMTVQDMVTLGSGGSFWTTRAAGNGAIPSITLTDGPHGLRAQGPSGDHLGIGASMAATCFPTASALASSWDDQLARAVGTAIGEEAVEQGVNVVLGPGVNMKRNPLCGRNFEYLSEDPYLSGMLAASWIRGVQDTGVGTSIKHFALNNQELKRMTTDVRVDERALHEYYLPAFEIAVKDSDPTTVMCAYNRVEGVFCSDNRELLTTVLRERWGFRGAVVTDWGAMNDRVAAYDAGTDLEMPGNGGTSDAVVFDALEQGSLDRQSLADSAQRIVQLVQRTAAPVVTVPAGAYEQHHELAYRAAVESAVLLKNDGDLLPLKAADRVVVLGEMARTPRYQGAGSSQVNPTRLVSLLDGMKQRTTVEFAPGYTLVDRPDDKLRNEAVALAERADKIVVCVGLTDINESEGFDRAHMRISNNQIALLHALAPFANRVVLVLVGGGAIEMPWESRGAAILHMQLAGQAGGQAAADLIFGLHSPSGKLAETYPARYEDVVNADRFGIEEHQTPYVESMYCGYRYFDSADIDVRYPFGFGLSYTTFEYSDLTVTPLGEYDYAIALTVSNTGTRDGAEVVQGYVAPRTHGVHRPRHELKAYTKVHVPAGESRRVEMRLSRRSFTVFDPATQDWVVERGSYHVEIGSHSRDIRLTTELAVKGVTPARSNASYWYYSLQGKPTLDDFLTIHAPFPTRKAPSRGNFDDSSSLQEMRDAGLIPRLVYYAIEKEVAKRNGGKVDYDDVQFKMMMLNAAGLPMRAMVAMSGGAMPASVARLVIRSANGHSVRALVKLALGR